MSLAVAFRAHLPAEAALRLPPPGATDDHPDPLDADLAQMVSAAQAAWPMVTVAAEEFVAYLAARMSAGDDPLAALAKLHASDLYLACGCTRGDAPALAAFERHFMARLAAHLQRGNALTAFTDEVKQAVRVRLLVSTDGLAPRIASYRGQGPLGVWLRLAAARLAVNLRQAEKRPPDAADLGEMPAAGLDPELGFFKAHYGDELRRAVEGALLALPARDGNLLRLHFFDHLSADAIGAMHGVSGRTVHRWLSDIRERILAETRRLMGQRLQISQDQFESVVGLVGSQIELSVRRLLEKLPGEKMPG